MANAPQVLPRGRCFVRKPKPRTPRTPRPIDCVTLTADPGRSSGWCIGARGMLMRWGELDPFRGRPILPVDVVRDALELGLALGNIPIAFGLEAPYGGRANAMAGLENARGIWKAAWLTQGGVKRRMLSGHRPGSWRADAFEEIRPKPKTREDWQDLERRTAITLTGDDTIGGDASAAVCMQSWLMRSGDLWLALPRTKRALI